MALLYLLSVFVLGNQVALTKIIGSFRINDGNGKDNAIIKNFIGRVWKNNRAARAARTYEQVRAVLFKQQREITTLPF